MALGPGAKLMLDKFVYDGEKTKGTIAVNLVKGAFRFVTGVAAKPSYVVRVPQASITVRGTIFDVFVQDNGVSWLLLHEGAVTVCNERGKCRDLDEPGKLIRITRWRRRRALALDEPEAKNQTSTTPSRSSTRSPRTAPTRPDARRHPDRHRTAEERQADEEDRSRR